MIIFGSDMILIGSIFQVHEPSVLLVAVVLINSGVKKQVLQVSFKIVVGDLMLVFFYKFYNIIFLCIYVYFGNNIYVYFYVSMYILCIY